MFKNLALSIVAGLVFSGSALAQEQKPKTFPLAVMAHCAEKSVALGIISQFEEIPFVTGTNRTQAFPSAEMLEGTLKMFVNPDTWVYTIFITDPTEELWCMLTSGEELAVGDGGNGI